MNYDELAFFNQQLAGMLKSGIPLEGALHQLSSGMRRGKLRDELTKLQEDLAQGTPFEKALAKRKLPPTYIEMLRAGIRSNDLPGTLTLVADHYQRLSLVLSRLAGLMVYPMLVLAAALGLSIFLIFLQERILHDTGATFGMILPLHVRMFTWLPPATIILMIGLFSCSLLSTKWRRHLKWRVPAFRDAHLAQLASTGEILLRRGNTLPETLTFLSELERGSPAGKALQSWNADLAEGKTHVPEAKGATLPPLFFWILKSAGEDLADGFRRVADIYQKRAAHRLDWMLFAALPVSIVLLAIMLIAQLYPVIGQMLQFVNMSDGSF
ncbi:MAG: type II secretion system F family protein [Limisphaerales bacterium]